MFGMRKEESNKNRLMRLETQIDHLDAQLRNVRTKQNEIDGLQDKTKQMYENIIGLSNRLQQLECFASGGHKHRFKERIADNSIFSAMNLFKPIYIYIFACACGHTITKTEAELSKAERKALVELGVMEGK